jgi:hypothetical protein
MGKFKAGDRVQYMHYRPGDRDVTIGDVYRVITVNGDGWFRVMDDDGEPQMFKEEQFELYEKHFTPKTGDKILVTDAAHSRWVERIYLATTSTGKIIVAFNDEAYEDFKDGIDFQCHQWEQMKEAEPVYDLTKEEIEEKLGIKINIIE